VKGTLEVAHLNHNGKEHRANIANGYDPGAGTMWRWIAKMLKLGKRRDKMNRLWKPSHFSVFCTQHHSDYDYDTRNTPEIVAARAAGHVAYYKEHPEIAEAWSLKMKAYWADPEWRAMVMKKSKEGIQKAKEMKNGKSYSKTKAV
jgi:hypothetical protein